MVEDLYKRTARILGIDENDVKAYCCGGDEDSLEIVTPEELAYEILEYTGEIVLD